MFVSPSGMEAWEAEAIAMITWTTKITNAVHVLKNGNCLHLSMERSVNI